MARTLTPALAPLATALCLAATPAAAYQLLGTTWDTERGPSPYVIDPNGSDDISDGSDVEAVRTAFEAWSCIEGSRFRFQERVDVEGIAVADLMDGINTVFWDEDGTSGVDLGPSTLGVNIGDGAGAGGRRAADIVFNGMDHTWSTDDAASAVDVGSIAIHEIGHWLGLGHACTDMTESNCLPTDQAVMTPVYTDGVWRDPGDDDIAGLLSMYPQDPGDESRCNGPYSIGQFCACDDECAGALRCVAQDDGSNQCVSTCDSDNPDCGPGFNCILGQVAEGEDVAPGKCIRGVGGQAAQVGAVCQNNGMCGARDCTQLGATAGQRVCFQACQDDDDCEEGYACSGIACLLDPAQISIACPDPDPQPDGDGTQEDGCACAKTGDRSSLFSVLLLLPLVATVVRRKRR